MSDNNLSIAVIGTGSFGAQHARTLAAIEGVKLAALVDRDDARARQLANELNVAHVFTDPKQLIESRLVEAVIIATHTETHVAIAKQALAAGLHVLVEKPVGKDLADTQDLDRTALASKCVAMAGHICMFHSQAAELIERVRTAGFRCAHFRRFRPAQHVRDFPGYHPIALTTVHDLYMAAQMAGGVEPEIFDAMDATDDQGNIALAWSMLRWRDGRVATFHSNWMLSVGSPAAGIDSIEVFGGDYHAHVQTNPANLSVTDARTNHPIGLEISVVDGRPVGMLAEELRSFASACRTGKIPAGCRMSDAVQVQRWMDRLMESARAKREQG